MAIMILLIWSSTKYRIFDWSFLFSLLLVKERQQNTASFFRCNKCTRCSGNRIVLSAENGKYIIASNDHVTLEWLNPSNLANAQFAVVDYGYGWMSLKSIYGTYLSAIAPKQVPYASSRVYGVNLTSNYPDDGAIFQVRNSYASLYKPYEYLFGTYWEKYLKANTDDSLTADGSIHDSMIKFRVVCI